MPLQNMFGLLLLLLEISTQLRFSPGDVFGVCVTLGMELTFLI